MAQSKKGAKGQAETSKEPFVAQEDRPEVRIDPETPVSELRVRDLSAILGSVTNKIPYESSWKRFFDTKDFVKELKVEKIEKPEKFEKFEKHELKELKLEKVENDLVADPVKEIGPDPRFESVIQAVTGLTRQVGQLADQLEDLRRKVDG